MAIPVRAAPLSRRSATSARSKPSRRRRPCSILDIVVLSMPSTSATAAAAASVTDDHGGSHLRALGAHVMLARIIQQSRWLPSHWGRWTYPSTTRRGCGTYPPQSCRQLAPAKFEGRRDRVATSIAAQRFGRRGAGRPLPSPAWRLARAPDNERQGQLALCCGPGRRRQWPACRRRIRGNPGGTQRRELVGGRPGIRCTHAARRLVEFETLVVGEPMSVGDVGIVLPSPYCPCDEDACVGWFPGAGRQQAPTHASGGSTSRDSA